MKRALPFSRRGDGAGRASRGATLLEAMIAGAILMIGLLGLLTAQIFAARQNHMAARQMRAAAVARDLASAVQRWDYATETLSGGRLVNGVTANDTTTYTSGTLSAAPVAASYDYDVNANWSATLAAPPLSNAAIDHNEDGQPDFQRYLVVAPAGAFAAGNTNVVGRRITVVVAWNEAGQWRQVVLFQLKHDPATVANGNIPGL